MITFGHDEHLSRQFPDPAHLRFDLFEVNQHLATTSTQRVIEWADHLFDDGLVLTTSFGIQSAAMLHLATQVKPDIPVIWIDTGYLPPETHEFAAELTERLDLNLRVYRGDLSPEEMEMAYGRLWESDDLADLNRYDQIRKVEPMRRALREANASAWLSGLRHQQTDFRRTLEPLSYDGYRYKILPILNWSSQDVDAYLARHQLPHHPLYFEGYVSVGDWHSSRPVQTSDTHERDSRFHGLKQECGIHLPGAVAA